MPDTVLSSLPALATVAGEELMYLVSEGASYRKKFKEAIGLLLGQPGGILTLTSGVPETTSDVTAAANVYYTPFKSNLISLWDTDEWVLRTFTEAQMTLALGTGTSGKPYDVYADLDGAGNARINKLIWTDDTTRATALTWLDGRACLGDRTKLLLGTYYTTSTTTTEDSAANRYLSNVYHARPRHMAAAKETTNTWNFNGTWRQANANAANQLNAVFALPGRMVDVLVLGLVNDSGTRRQAAVGVGVDSTSTNSAQLFGSNSYSSTFINQLWASYRGAVAAGRHYFPWLESGGGTTLTWGGDENAPTDYQAGINGWCLN